RISGVAKKGAATAQEVDRAASQMLATKAALERAKVRLERAAIAAPIDGVLNRIMVEEGEYVRVGAPVAEIVEIDTVKVVAMVPEFDIGYIRVAKVAAVVTEVDGEEKTLAGEVKYVSELADERTRATRVEIELDNKERLLRSGRIVRVLLTRRTLENVVMVPLFSVIPMEDGKAVYVVEEGKAVRRDVKINTRFIRTLDWGGRKLQRIQIVEGLKAGERLITAGQQFVAPGQAIKVVTETDAAPPDPDSGKQ
ncbi:MAG: efflux RND transporter periplasmic adaptor subunit, partial [Planctomycetota bacterium]